jgi:RimJ/RimL family protein N-acetyltransferase
MSRIEPRKVTLRSGARILLRCPEESDAASTLAFDDYMRQTHDFNVVLQGESDRTEEMQAAWLREHLDTDGWLAIIALAGPDHNDLIGKISFRNSNRKRLAHHGTFGISVHADWRGRGVGTAMIESLLDWAAAHPVIDKVCLGVWEANTGARALYKRLGFTKEGHSARHFKLAPGEYADDITMGIFVKPGTAPARYNTWPACRPLP